MALWTDHWRLPRDSFPIGPTGLRCSDLIFPPLLALRCTRAFAVYSTLWPLQPTDAPVAPPTIRSQNSQRIAEAEETVAHCEVVGEGSLNADGTRRRRLAWESELRAENSRFGPPLCWQQHSPIEAINSNFEQLGRMIDTVILPRFDSSWEQTHDRIEKLERRVGVIQSVCAASRRADDARQKNRTDSEG